MEKLTSSPWSILAEIENNVPINTINTITIRDLENWMGYFQALLVPSIQIFKRGR